jgi:hypothetical protein
MRIGADTDPRGLSRIAATAVTALVLAAVAVAAPFTTSATGAPAGDDPAARQVLGEVTALHLDELAVTCAPHATLQWLAGPPDSGWAGFALLGNARIVKGTSLVLDETLVCAPLAAYAVSPRGGPSSAVLLALSVVAHAYGHHLGLKGESAIECFAAQAVWKWVRSSGARPSVVSAARRFLLDNSRRPAAYRLAAGCSLAP